MKKIKLILLSMVTLFGVFGCENDNDMLTGDRVTGGLISMDSPLVGYVIGNGVDREYKVKLSFNQGNTDIISEIDVYKVFTTLNDDGDEVSSNETLLGTIKNLPTTEGKHSIEYLTTYNELIKNLKVDGASLPSDDSKMKIGDAWTLKFVSKLSNSRIHENSLTTKIAVGTRFAGKYKVIQGEYWRIGVHRTDITWDGEFRIIESVDATTYRFVDHAGPFDSALAPNTHYFTIDNDLNVHTPVMYNGVMQMLNGGRMINCEETPGDISHACGFDGPQNIVVKDDVTGKDKIYRTYGYYTTGPREFYEVLEKVVE